MDGVPQLLAGRYQVGDLIARGSFTDVLEARDLALGRPVAVKILRSELAGDALALRRVHAESQLTGRLRHPNIVELYDFGREYLIEEKLSLPWMVRELLSGRTLRDDLLEGSRFSTSTALDFVAQVCDALDFVHQQQLVHGEVSPSKLLFAPSGELKLSMAGSVRQMGTSSISPEDDNTVLGTAEYLAPEVARGEIEDGRADLYLCGCILYELLTGRPPFTGDSPVAVAHAHVNEVVVPPSRINSLVTPQVDDLVLTALAKSPEDRFPTGAAMRAALAAAEHPAADPVEIRLPQSRVPSSSSSTIARSASSSASSVNVPTPPVSSVNVPTPRASGGNVAPPRASGVNVPTPRASSVNVPPPRAVTIKRPTVLGVTRGERIEEAHGEDVYTFDNSKSSSTSTEELRTAHTARIEMTLDFSKARSAGGQAGVRFFDLASVEAKIQNDVLAKHALSIKEELVFEQSTSIQIPASTHVRVIVRWVRIWQEGVVLLGDRAEPLAEVPYAVTVALRFDKITSDVD